MVIFPLLVSFFLIVRVCVANICKFTEWLIYCVIETLLTSDALRSVHTEDSSNNNNSTEKKTTAHKSKRNETNKWTKRTAKRQLITITLLIIITTIIILFDWKLVVLKQPFTHLTLYFLSIQNVTNIGKTKLYSEFIWMIIVCSLFTMYYVVSSGSIVELLNILFYWNCSFWLCCIPRITIFSFWKKKQHTNQINYANLRGFSLFKLKRNETEFHQKFKNSRYFLVAFKLIANSIITS